MFLPWLQLLMFGGGLATTLFAFTVLGPTRKEDPITGC
jgi:hypothetical protein